MIIKFIQVFHRILGTWLSILFLVWFLSGFVMIYHTFPKVSQTDKRLHMEPIPATGLPALEEVLARLPQQDHIQKLIVDCKQEQVVFHIVTDEGSYYLPADSTAQLRPVTGNYIQTIASRWCTAPVEQIDTLYHLDQWIPFGRLSREFPIYKFHFADTGRCQLYISSRTGEVLQLTNRTNRFWGWLGAIPHWVYFTSLRQDAGRWITTVVWLSGIGCIVCLSGLILGIRSWFLQYRRRKGGFTPYRKFVWKWHHITGFVFGLFVFTFVFSGMMSLADVPGWLVKVHNPAINKKIYQSTPVTPGHYAIDYRELPAAWPGEVKEIEWTSFGEVPFYKVTVGKQQKNIRAVNSRPEPLLLTQEEVSHYIAGIHAEPFRITTLEAYDNYYVGRTGHLPLPVYHISVADADKSTYYINPKNGNIRYFNTNRKVKRWSYQGLHSFKFKFLVERPVLWNIVMWGTMLGGTAVSLTGVWLGYRYIKRLIKRLKKYICKNKTKNPIHP